jgi:hypothetical protein
MVTTEPLMKFRLLRGIHNHGGMTYRPGDIVESSTDLAKRLNAPGSIRFERIHEDPTPLDEVLAETTQPAGRRSKQPVGG